MLNDTKLLIFLQLLILTGQLSARQWTVYISLQAHDSYTEALSVVHQLEQSLAKDSADDIKVCVDIQTGVKVERFEFIRGIKRVLPAEVHKNTIGQIKQGCGWAFSDAQEGRTLFILSGHGTGIISPTYNAQKKRWMYEPDEGTSPCKRLCSTLQNAFCKQVEHIIDGKSFIIADEGNSFISVQELNEVMQYVSSELLGRKIDIIGFDSCYMAMLEIAYEVKEYGTYLVASQECEDKGGWQYNEVIKALMSKAQTGTIARQLVHGYERIQRTRGLGRYSLSLFDLSRITELAQALDEVVLSWIPLIQRDESVIKATCSARIQLHKMCGLPFYADLGEFLEALLEELNEVKRNDDIDRLTRAIIDALEALNTVISASVAGRMCLPLHGCSIYFPTAHIDSTYRGLFASRHQWVPFLKEFTLESSYCVS